MPELGIPRENMVFIWNRLFQSVPLLHEHLRMHTIHGRAPAFATGLKVARPELSVWIVTGMVMASALEETRCSMLRRNLDVNILLFNNRIYGLTKARFRPPRNRD